MKIKQTIPLLLILLTIFFPSLVRASTQVFLEPHSPYIEKGKKYKVDISINPLTRKNYVSKIELNFPPDLLEISNFKFAKNWLQVYSPEYSSIDNINGTLIKTAGYPGGFSSETLFGTVTFKAKEDLVGSISVSDKSFSLDEEKQNAISISLPSIAFSPKTIPDDLFDISLDASSNRALSLKDIIFNINLENFGKTTTPIDLYFNIYNDKNILILEEHERVIVETEKVSIKEFNKIDLNPGKYKIVLVTKYGNNVIDEFTKEIEIIKKTKLQYIYKYKELITLLFIAILLTIAIFMQDKKTKTKLHEK